MPNAPLCSHEFPSGKPCRQIPLKDEQLCRHHMRPFRHNMYQVTHDEAMERLRHKLNGLDLAALLRSLQAKLNKIQPVVRSHPEAQLALHATLDRLRQILSTDSNSSSFTETSADSISY